MIFFLIILDVLINNYSNFTSFFFLIYLYNKPYKYYVLTALILDLVIFNHPFYNLIFLSVIYLLNKVFTDLNKNNILNFIFINTFNLIVYIILSNLSSYFSIPVILVNIGNSLFINLLFYMLSYNCYNKGNMLE